MSDAPAPDASSEDREREEAARWAEIVAQLTAVDEPVRAPEDIEGHFEPPEPPPLPRLHPVTAWSLVAALAGATVLVVPAALGRPVSGLLAAAAVLALIAGCAGLVYRLRTGPGGGPDDGAVV